MRQAIRYLDVIWVHRQVNWGLVFFRWLARSRCRCWALWRFAIAGHQSYSPLMECFIYYKSFSKQLVFQNNGDLYGKDWEKEKISFFYRENENLFLSYSGILSKNTCFFIFYIYVWKLDIIIEIFTWSMFNSIFYHIFTEITLKSKQSISKKYT